MAVAQLTRARGRALRPGTADRSPGIARAGAGESQPSAARRKTEVKELVVRTAVPEGTFAGTVSGYLYFGFTGKASKIKSVELLYRDATLKLK
jgi:hypothetical protein